MTRVTGHAAICTILRNTASTINALRVAVEAVGALFDRHTLLAVESGSTDDTRQKLQKWQRDDPIRVHLILPKSGKPHHGYWRNRYLKFVLRDSYEYMLVLDGDSSVRVPRTWSADLYARLSLVSRCG